MLLSDNWFNWLIPIYLYVKVIIGRNRQEQMCWMNLQFYRVTFWITTDFIKSSWSKFKHAKQSEVLPLRFELFLTFVGLSNSRVSFEMLFFWCFKSLCAFLNDDNERWLAICSKSSLCKRHRCKKDNLLNHCCYFEDQMKTDEKEAGRLLLVPC